MECALSGASKTQVIREFKNRYKCVLLSFDALQGACEKHTN